MTMQVLSGVRIEPCLEPGRNFGVAPSLVTGLLAVASLAFVQGDVRDRWTAYRAGHATEGAHVAHAAAIGPNLAIKRLTLSNWV